MLGDEPLTVVVVEAGAVDGAEDHLLRHSIPRCRDPVGHGLVLCGDESKRFSSAPLFLSLCRGHYTGVLYLWFGPPEGVLKTGEPLFGEGAQFG
jgi:hypothetical protein